MDTTVINFACAGGRWFVKKIVKKDGNTYVYFWTKDAEEPWSLVSNRVSYFDLRCNAIKAFIDSRHPLDDCDFSDDEYEISSKHDQAMWNKGYRFKLTPTDQSFQPLYAKTVMDCGPLVRGYPKHLFDIIRMG